MRKDEVVRFLIYLKNRFCQLTTYKSNNYHIFFEKKKKSYKAMQSSDKKWTHYNRIITVFWNFLIKIFFVWWVQ